MRPPIFIALKRNGAVSGHVRADRIESVTAEKGQEPYITRVHTMSGISIWTDETIEHVFAKMADALNIERKEEP